MKIEKIRNKDGITLIALIITIIVMLILAGIVLGLTISENGIMKKAEGAGLAYSEQEAREKLELVLLDMQADKVVNTSYDQYGYLTKKIQEKGMDVNGDLVFVDGWRFTIDRNVPKISGSIGKGQPNEEIKLTLSQEVSSDYVKSTIKVEIEYAGIISFIQIAGEEIQVPEKQDGKYIVTKEVTQNGTYSVLVKDEENKYQMKSIEVTEITEDMDIKNKEELEAFRDRVNSGRTYEGRTVRVVADIDLQGTEENQWTPIGDYGTNTNLMFKGTFKGNYHTISNLYINITKNYQGLFGYVSQGEITEVIIGSDSNITGNSNVGGIAGYIENSKISNCGNNGKIVGGQAYKTYIGGIVGRADTSIITGTYNKGEITGGNVVCCGGIAGLIGGTNNTNSLISYSYNLGKITGVNSVGGIIGRISDYGRVKNCYNTGEITGIYSSNINSNSIGGVSGRLRAYGEEMYCYNLGTVINNSSNGVYVGGISGGNEAYNGSTHVAARGSRMQYNYNSGNVSGKNGGIGGITGLNAIGCYVLNCHVSTEVIVKYNSTPATMGNGSASMYLGKLIGQPYSTSSTYVYNTLLEPSNMPSVYNVVNGLSDGDSEYWSKDNVNSPKLKWEK